VSRAGAHRRAASSTPCSPQEKAGERECHPEKCHVLPRSGLEGILGFTLLASLLLFPLGGLWSRSQD
jgi:hypothetical protein